VIPATAHVRGDVILIALTPATSRTGHGMSARSAAARPGQRPHLPGRQPSVPQRRGAGPLLEATFSPVLRAGTRLLGVRRFLRPQAVPAGS